MNQNIYESDTLKSSTKTEGFSSINPTNKQKIKEYQYMTDKAAASIVANCHNAFLEWRHKSFKERSRIIKAIGEGLRNNKQEFAELMTEEMGKLISHGIQEVALCADICDYTAENTDKELADEERDLPNGGKGTITYSPTGVIYGIQPWNFPCYQVIRYSIANLMAGNGVLLKHADNVTGSAIFLKQIYEDAGLPKDLFSVLIIDHKQSNKIIGNDLVRGVTFTGSPAGGAEVAKVAGKELKKTVLELGSNDAYLVLHDADIELAAKTCVNGRIYNNGETCVAAKRFIVVEAVYDTFKKAFVDRMKQVKLGDPSAEGTQLGPMARKDLLEKLVAQIDESVAKGAEILCGGGQPDRDGFFYEATVLGNVQPGQPAYDGELFGPVASLIKTKNEEDAMRFANDSRFGLGGGIFSKDEKRAFELAKTHFDTGMVFINSFGLAQPNMPFGGVKDSGYGREHGGFGVREFVNAKAIMALNSN